MLALLGKSAFIMYNRHPLKGSATGLPSLVAIPADLITASIYKGDGANAIPQDWFELNKPNEWKSRKAVGGPYGKLKFVKLNYEVAIDVLDEAIDREIADPESGVTLPRASEAMKELFNYEKIEEQTDYPHRSYSNG